jgi:molybdopterin-guanine dinucleotide biosynthesis protein A
LHTAFTNASNPYLLVVACDMPWLNRSLLEFQISLRTTADVIVPRWNEYPEPLHAVYSKRCLEPVQWNIEAGNLKTISFYDSVDVRYLERDEISRYDPRGISFANINSPEDLEKAEYKK